MTARARLRNNDRVYLSLSLGAVKFDLQARVVHAGSKDGATYQCGLRFVGLSELDYKQLTNFIHDPKHGWQFDAPPPPWEPDPA